MPKSSVYPGLERKPGGPDNWVEATGGLPKYIERIAKHLHYEKGMTIQHAIATAVNTVKRWARKGGVVKYNDPNNKHVTTITAAQAAAAVAQWEAKKAMARGSASGGRSGRLRRRSIKLSEASVDLNALAKRANAMSDPAAKVKARAAVLDLAFPAGGPPTEVRKKMASKGTALPDGSFPIDDVVQLKKAVKAFGRAKDKAAAKRHIIKRARALNATSALPKDWRVDLAKAHEQILADLALTRKMTSDDKSARDAIVKEARSTIKTLGPLLAKVSDQRVLSAMIEQIQSASSIIRQAGWWNDPSEAMTSLSADEQAWIDLAMTKDGRKSFKHQGKWKHGFVPVDPEAKQAKAKGSPIAAKRVDRLFGSPTKAANASRAATKQTLANRAKREAAHGYQIRSNTGKKGGGQQERVQDVGQSLHADIRDAKPNQRQKVAVLREASIKGARRAPARATQPWDQIPESEKTIRNGKKYVMSTFDGKNLLTEWMGNNPVVVAPGKGERQYTSIREQDAKKMSTAEIRALLKSGKQSPQVIKMLNKVLKAKSKQKAASA